MCMLQVCDRALKLCRFRFRLAAAEILPPGSEILERSSAQLVQRRRIRCLATKGCKTDIQKDVIQGQCHLIRTLKRQLHSRPRHLIVEHSVRKVSSDMDTVAGEAMCTAKFVLWVIFQLRLLRRHFVGSKPTISSCQPSNVNTSGSHPKSYDYSTQSSVGTQSVAFWPGVSTRRRARSSSSTAS